MAYAPSSAVSHFKKIVSISNLNDWLIADGVFFRHSMYHFVIKLKEKSSGVPMFYSKRCSVARSMC